MKKYFKKIIMLLLVSSLLISTSTKTYAISDNVTIEEGKEYLEFLSNKILNEYYGKDYDEITLKKLLEAAYKGMFSVLDDYSEFYTYDEYKTYIDDKSGVKYGMGATVQKHNEGAIIIDVIKGSSAEEVGLLPNDIIIKVDGIDVSKMTLDEIVSLVTGEKGTKVNLTVNRAGNLLNFDIIRCEVKDDPVEYFLLSDYTNDERDNKTIYLALSSFNQVAYEFFSEAFEEYEDANKLILDLRDNGGGYTDEALKICSYLLDADDEIITLKDRKGNESTYSSKSKRHMDNIVVLINNHTASASEVTTGALRDNKKAIVVGEHSYGKNVSQTIYNYNQLQFKLTEEVYFTPSGESVLGKGIIPDILVETPKFINDVKYKYYGDEESDDILCVKSMLKFLGYNVTDNSNKYDKNTLELVKKFQGDNGLGVYGGIDYTTQRKLNEVAYNKYISDDIQLNKAIEVIRNYDEYFKELIK